MKLAAEICSGGYSDGGAAQYLLAQCGLPLKSVFGIQVQHHYFRRVLLRNHICYHCYQIGDSFKCPL
jgi:hypothetical protein